MSILKIVIEYQLHTNLKGTKWETSGRKTEYQKESPS